MFAIRIDDRFIHGQVGCTWISYNEAKEVLVVNDALAQDSLAITMQKLSAPAVKVSVKSVKDAIPYLQNYPNKTHLFVIVSCPQDALALIEAGISFPEINIGHSRHTEFSREIVPHINVDEAALSAYQKLQDLQVPMTFRLVPDHRRITVNFHDFTW